MRLAFVGDVMLGRLVNDKLKHEAPAYPWGDTLPIIRDTDIRICNLECVITDYGQPYIRTSKVFHFRTDEKNIDVLNSPPINMVSIANNHVLDFEYEGLLRMLEVLKKGKIVFAGAGSSLYGAQSLAIYNFNGIKIGLIAFTDNEPHWEAKDKIPGVFYAPIDSQDKRAIKLLDLIKKAHTKVDILIVSAHWGPNWGYHPQPDHIPFAKSLIESGADIVFGHSPHIFQGVEIYKSKVIIYSAGDFIDDYAVDEIERNDQSFIFIIEIQNNKITRLKLCPTIIRNMQSHIANEPEASEIASKMRKLCRSLGTDTIYNQRQKYIEITL